MNWHRRMPTCYQSWSRDCLQFQKSGGSSGSNDRGDLASQAKQKEIHMVPQCKITCSVRLSVRTLAFHAGKEGFDSPTEHHYFYSQASIRYRVGTPTLFGSQRPATDPDITAFGFGTVSAGLLNWHSRCLTIKIWSDSISVSISHCHCEETGSIPVRTAKFLRATPPGYFPSNGH